MPLTLLDRAPAFWESLTRTGGPFLKGALKHVSAHTGIPIVIVASIALVMSWRMAKRSIRFIVEVGIAFVLIFTLTELGVIKW